MDDSSDQNHIVFAGGGTGGHLFPGLAVVDELARDRIAPRITFAGRPDSFESRHVEAAGHGFLPVRCRPWPRQPFNASRFVLENLLGFQTAKRFIRRHDVSLVVGLGGYVSVPMARAAVSLGVPLVLLEQNATPGRATRWLAGKATLVCAAFEQICEQLRPRTKVQVTGNPLRREFADISTHEEGRRAGRPRTLTILGGSQGADSLNRHVPLALGELRGQLTGWRIVHQAGTNHARATRDLYRRLRLPAHVVPFVSDMPRLLTSTDLVICRAGGTTLAELAAANVPAVLVPYPYAADDHQRQNAEVFVSAGACRVVPAPDKPEGLWAALSQSVGDLLQNDSRRRAMAASMAGLARPLAARDVADSLSSILAAYRRHPAA